MYLGIERAPDGLIRQGVVRPLYGGTQRRRARKWDPGRAGIFEPLHGWEDSGFRAEGDAS